MNKRQEWVFNYTPPTPRMDVGGKLAPLIVPGVELIVCKSCSSEITILRSKSRFKGETNRMLRSFQNFYPLQPKECSCGDLKVEVDPEGRLTIYTDHLDKVSWCTRSPQGVVVTLAHSLHEIPVLDCPPLELYSKTVYKNPKWEIQMLSHLDMHQFTPTERRIVLPSTDADRAFFLRCYTYTYKICVSEDGYTYLPSGHRVNYDPTLQGLKSYPEHLIANLHLFSTKNLRLELEGLTDPFHMANLTQQYAKQLRVP